MTGEDWAGICVGSVIVIVVYGIAIFMYHWLADRADARRQLALFDRQVEVLRDQHPELFKSGEVPA